MRQTDWKFVWSISAILVLLIIICILALLS